MTTELRAGLIGAHISRSRLKAGLALMCESEGLPFSFDLIDTAISPDFDFRATVNNCHANGWTGVTVTHPYKPDGAKFAGEAMHDDVRRLGAANTLVFGPPLQGFNTDFTGFLSAWRTEFGATSPGRVTMAGAGGVARALGPALAQLGALDLAIWDQNAGLAQELAALIGGPARAVEGYQVTEAISEANGLVNATPLGMADYPGSAFQIPLRDRPDWAFEAVYTPVMTPFLIAAKDAGAQILTGFDLFRHMALRSFTAYTGITPDATTILERLKPLKPT